MTFRPEVIDRELKRMIEALERPLNYDLIRLEDCLSDFSAIGIHFTALTLGQALKRLGHWRTPRMNLPDWTAKSADNKATNFSVLWAIRDQADYRRMAPLRLRNHYAKRLGQPQPELGQKFVPGSLATIDETNVIGSHHRARIRILESKLKQREEWLNELMVTILGPKHEVFNLGTGEAVAEAKKLLDPKR